MSREYPRVVDTNHKRKWMSRSGKTQVTPPPCCVCGAPSTHKPFVQVNWFRGDDEGPFNACKAHRRDADALLATKDHA